MEVAEQIREKVVSFNDTKKAFSSKDDKQLTHSHWLFKLMGNPFLVRVFSKFTLLAIKLGLPVSAAIKATIFKQFCGGESIDESKEVVKKLSQSQIGAILDYSIEGKESEEDFEKTKNEIIRIIHLAKDNPAIPYTSLKLTGVARFGLLEKVNAKASLTSEESSEFEKAKKRLNEICLSAFENNVPIYFDAEESWIQDAIDAMAEEMMHEYNKNRAIVLTTLQMYRWDRLDYLNKLIAMARAENFYVGIKLVRGAYWEKENERAGRLGYRSPVHSKKEDTDKDFDKAVTICIQNIDKVVLCAGTHNEASTMHLLKMMKEYNVSNDNPNVYFSQLYGMSDHITYNLADAGYNVTKYLPYGPVKSVIPYLIRRAEENTAIAGQMSRELKLIIEEKKRRKLLPVVR